jgi:hypothetical protein
LFGFDSPREAKQRTSQEMSTNPSKNLLLVLLQKVAIFAILIAHLGGTFSFWSAPTTGSPIAIAPLM